MTRHRTTARGGRLLILSALLGLAVVLSASAAPKPGLVGGQPIVFPLIGDYAYTMNYGDPRGQGAHEGIDIEHVPWRTPVVAAESGTVKWWTTSWRAGCMLYLYGKSGTTYLYIHLNNDVTMKNDNRGKCVRGTAYAVKNGAKVAAGQQIGYVGDSGDANGGASHLHFEVHPGGGKAVSPYPYLQKAYKLLFTGKAGSPFALTLTGTVVSAAIDRIVVNVSTSQAWPSGLTLTKLNRTIALTVPETTTVQSLSPTGGLRTVANVTLAAKGDKIVLWTMPAPTTLKAERGDDDVLSSALIQLG